jgi:ring-1,2-phenylacetyl-CoA epoxidase subunit PaaC
MSEGDKDKALKELLYKIADNELIIGHRNSEWIGLGPIMEEDIAFGSLAQDKVGHAYHLYEILHHLGEADPDTMAFNRDEKNFKCSHLVEYPNAEYDFSLIRHFLFDHSEYIRFEMLSNSSNQSLADWAKKYKSEIKYHIFHADTWIKQLSRSTEESKARMQTALNFAFPLSFGIFEPGPYEEILKQEHIFEGEKVLFDKWLEVVSEIISSAGLISPKIDDEKAGYGGRYGYHTEYLKPLLKEMTEVFDLDIEATW